MSYIIYIYDENTNEPIIKHVSSIINLKLILDFWILYAHRRPWPAGSRGSVRARERALRKLARLPASVMDLVLVSCAWRPSEALARARTHARTRGGAGCGERV